MALPTLRGLWRTPALTASTSWFQRCTYSTGQLHVQVEPLDEPAGVSLLTLSRPDARNAIGRQMLSELIESINLLRLERTTRCVIVRSSVFCAGADLKERAGMNLGKTSMLVAPLKRAFPPGVFCAGADLKERAGMTLGETSEFVASLNRAFTALQALPMPTIALVEGLALGGGAEMALACDFRVLSEGAIFAFPETRLGIIPGAGGTQRLPRLIGPARAKELIFTGRRIEAFEALQIGLAEHVAKEDDVYNKTLALATDIAKGAPMSLHMAKAAISNGGDVDLASGLKVEEACYSQLLRSKDRLEGLKAFAEKRAPVYVGE
eukprot:gene2280-8548_t